MANHHPRRRGTGFQPLLPLTLFAAGAALTARSLLRHSRKISLQNKTALVTGGSRGLGLLLARRLASAGCRVAICARDQAELRRAESDLLRLSPHILAVQCDLTSAAQIEGMIDGIRRHFGPVDILINNAGTIQVGPAEHMTPADFDAAMQLHFYAPLHTTLAVVPDMKRRRQGRIVNISSIGGKLPAPHLLPYTASKFALTGLSEGLRAELAPHNVFVTTVAPGLMRTGSPRNAFFKGQHRKEHAWFTLADSLPFLSISADRAASQIIRALQHGDPELILSLPAKLAARLHAIFPNLSAELASLTTQLLPAPGGIADRELPGSQSRSDLSPSPLTALTERAAKRNNEI